MGYVGMVYKKYVFKKLAMGAESWASQAADWACTAANETLSDKSEAFALGRQRRLAAVDRTRAGRAGQERLLPSCAPPRELTGECDLVPSLDAPLSRISLHHRGRSAAQDSGAS